MIPQRTCLPRPSARANRSGTDEVVTTLLDRVLVATTQVSVPADVDRLTRQWRQLLTVVGADMERLSANPRHSRLFLEYSTLGVRSPGIRRKVRVGLETYRARLLALTEEVLHGAARPPAHASTPSTAATLSTAEGFAGVAVSLVHGCALQAVIDPKRFDADQHFDAAARLLDAWRHPPNGRQVEGRAVAVINRKNRSQHHLDGKDPVSSQYVPQPHPFSSRRPRPSASATPSSSS